MFLPMIILTINKKEGNTMDCKNHDGKCFNRRLGEIYEQIDDLLNDSLAEASSCGCNESCINDYGCCCCECNYLCDSYDNSIHDPETDTSYCMELGCGCMPEDCELCDEGHDDTQNDIFLASLDVKYFSDKLADIVNNLLKDLATIDKSIKDTKELINYEAIYEYLPPKTKKIKDDANNLKNKAVDSMPSVYDTKDYLEDAYKKAMKNIKKNSKLAK